MPRAYLTGIFPRSEELIAATRAFDRGRVMEEEVERIRQQDARSLIRLQEDHGLWPLTDGLLNWQDLLRPLAEAWEGIKLGGLVRWFDNNTFFRQPVLSADIKPTALGEKYFRVDLLPKEKEWKAILPGPYTFLCLSENDGLASQEILATIGRGISLICKKLEELGFAQVQLSEPCLVTSPPDDDMMTALRDAYESVRRSVRLEIALHAFFGAVGSRVTELLELPVDILGLDMYEEEWDSLRGVDFDTALACGCVDARNSLLETPREIADVGIRALEELSAKDVILCPNADLEFLPRRVAEEKVKALGSARELLQEVT